jgi:redox-sensitive bicupin YhaK (pirin superfamily)
MPAANCRRHAGATRARKAPAAGFVSALDEPIAARGPFVMSAAAEVAQAFDDYRLGLF